MATLALKRRTPSLGTLPPVTGLSVSSIETPLPNNSITNKPASSSLYHTCRSVLDRLLDVPGFDYYLDNDNLPPLNLTSPTTSEPSTPTLGTGSGDPLSKLWQIARQGSSLCLLFNTLKPETPLKINQDPGLNTVNSCKASVYHFLVACKKQLEFSESDLFTITDLYSNDTNGFVKVVNCINKILAKLEYEGIISAPRSPNRNSDPNAPKDTRDKVVYELVETERKYVQDLEILLEYKNELQKQSVLPPDTVHYIFGNLSSLLDFQRRFMIQIEDVADKAPMEQNFGLLFMSMEEAFQVYEPFCANYQAAQDIVQQESLKLQKLADILNPTYELPSMLIKPVQRICKYPLLLSQLIKATDKDWPHISEMNDGLESIQRVTSRVNEVQRQYENLQIVEDLKRRVEDWKGYAVEQFGQLALQDKFMMATNDAERELHVFFFEKILLICKEIKDKSKLSKTNSISIKKKRRASLQLKGKIFIASIIQIVNNSKNGLWSLKVFWRDAEMESFSLKCRNEEQLKLWEQSLNKILQENKMNGGTNGVAKRNVSNTQLASLAHLHISPRNYRDDDDAASFIDEEEEEEDESEDYSYDDEEDERRTRSRSNSITPAAYGRTRSNRSESSASDYHPVWRPGTAPLPSTSTSRHYNNMPGMTLPPLPKPNPSVSSSNALSTPTVEYETVVKYMTTGGPSNLPPREDTRPYPGSMGRAQSHSAASGVGLGLYSNNGHPPVPNPTSLSQTRLRSQSSPNIHRPNANPNWEHGHEMPINSRTIYNRTIDPNLPSPVEAGRTSPRLATHDASVMSNEPTTPGINVVEPLVQSPGAPGTVRLKLNFHENIYAIVVSPDIDYQELMDKVGKKIRVVAGLGPTDPLRIKYQDEDGDLITINSDDDVQMGFESRGSSNTINLFIS
ncbi:Guanine nucleotide exchange factor for Cdc42p [Umbelopsis sp. WA50703]